MAVKKITEDPKITDTIEIDFETTDETGVLINPYRVDTVVIYFIERDFTSGMPHYLEEEVNGVTTIMYYTNAIPVYSFGTSEVPAWFSTDTENAFITKNDNDEDGNVLIGNFTATWTPQLAREGDYFVCYTWTPLAASAKESAYQSFFVFGDNLATTALPSHQTRIGKYETLLERYLPEMYKLTLADTDVTPDVLARFHQAVAKSFTTVEDLANQLIDLMDANICHEAFLPYLSNLFKHKLRSGDPTLWRRQIKTAVANDKKKGTINGLIDALDAAGAKFQKFTQYWQIVSKSTWADGFVVTEDQTEFVLSKLAILPIDVNNFELYIRYHDTEEYVLLDNDYVQLTNNDGETTLTWITDGVLDAPIVLEENDVILVVYKIKTVLDQAIENYIRALPLADKRDVLETNNPKKNWNVKLIATDDVMFDTIISSLHPFHYPVIWGKVRTEFAYSENVYNAEEYNGSLRDSINPCDIDGSFLDSCSACLSSIIAVDVEIEDLSNDRITEVTEIITDNVPFHAQIDAVNYSGAVNEYVIPPTEDVEILVFWSFNQNILIGQNEFTHAIPNSSDTSDMLARDMLSTSSVAVTDTGTAFNEEIVLFAPNHRFEDGVDVSPNTQNLLEILNGPNAGTYNVDNPGINTIAIVQGSPDSIPYPLNTSAFSFNLSNEITSDLSSDITQDDLYIFSESSQDFLSLELVLGIDSAAPSQLVITTGIYSGNYDIYDILPDNTLIINGFPATSNVSNLKYRITNNSQTVTLLNRSTTGAGRIAVTRRGKVETIDLRNDWLVKNGDYIRYSGVDYKIIGFVDDSTVYILDYDIGTVAGVPIKVYRRVVTEGTGYVDVRGMYLTTGTDYEAGLDVQNGSNPPVVPVESSSFRENFLVVINDNYYVITGWDANRIDLSGPAATWGLGGTSVSYQILQYDNVSPIDHVSQQYDHELVRFQRLDRRGNESVTYSTESLSMYQQMMMGAAALNNGRGGSEVIEQLQTTEAISFTIEYADGRVEQGEI
jgi:hypothetical protein